MRKWIIHLYLDEKDERREKLKRKPPPPKEPWKLHQRCTFAGRREGEKRKERCNNSKVDERRERKDAAVVARGRLWQAF